MSVRLYVKTCLGDFRNDEEAEYFAYIVQKITEDEDQQVIIEEVFDND
jgi:hypothetical protein